MEERIKLLLIGVAIGRVTRKEKGIHIDELAEHIAKSAKKSIRK